MDLRKKEVMKINHIHQNMKKNHIKVSLKLQKRLQMFTYKSINKKNKQSNHPNQHTKQNLPNIKKFKNMNKKFFIQPKQQSQALLRIKR